MGNPNPGLLHGALGQDERSNAKQKSLAGWGAGREVTEAQAPPVSPTVNRRSPLPAGGRAERSSGQSRCLLSLVATTGHDFHPSLDPRQWRGHQSPWSGPLRAPGTLKLELLLFPPSASPSPSRRRGGGRAWPGEARAFQRAERARATKEPGSWRGESRGCGTVQPSGRLGRRLARGWSREPSPALPARAWPPSRGREVVLMVGEGMGLEIGGPGGSRS